jgi:hypothetical protein
MRNHPILLLMLCISSYTISFASPYPSATSTPYYPADWLTAVVTNDLVNSIWQVSGQEFIFNESGLVSVKEAQTSWKTYTWDLEVESSFFYLSLYDGRCDKVVYRLEREGEIYRWMNTTTNTIVKMDSKPTQYNENMMTARRSLVGNWSSRFFPKKVIKVLEDENQVSIISADFNYVLSEDGTFKKTIFLNQEKYSTVNGLWEVSSDGNTLILHIQGKDCNYQTVEADIKLLSMDELVLDQALATMSIEKQICQNKETFFYNKI